MSDPQSCRWWVVTDLDGTLMDHHYDWSPAAPVLRSLQRAGVPVIPCTSKTAEEVERFRADAQLRDPYIVENGGAIHGETATGEAWEEALGPGWSELKPRLQQLSEQLAEPLRALDELTDAEGEHLLGLTGALLQQAQRAALQRALCRPLWRFSHASMPWRRPRGRPLCGATACVTCLAGSAKGTPWQL